MTSDLMQAMQANLLSPAVLFFLLGVFATLCKSDLKFPEPLYLGLTRAIARRQRDGVRIA